MGVLSPKAETVPELLGYLFLDARSMGPDETWGHYIGRIDASLPDWLQVVSGRYVEDLSTVDTAGPRFLQGESFLDHARGPSGHYFVMLIA